MGGDIRRCEYGCVVCVRMCVSPPRDVCMRAGERGRCACVRVWVCMGGGAEEEDSRCVCVCGVRCGRDGCVCGGKSVCVCVCVCVYVGV